MAGPERKPLPACPTPQDRNRLLRSREIASVMPHLDIGQK